MTKEEKEFEELAGPLLARYPSAIVCAMDANHIEHQTFGGDARNLVFLAESVKNSLFGQMERSKKIVKNETQEN